MSALLLGLLLAVPSLAAESARVLVVEQGHSGDGHERKRVQRRVRARLSDQEVGFYAGHELYQAGRREYGVEPAQQRASVPDSAVAEVQELTRITAEIPSSALSDADWGLKAQELRAEADKIWFVDRAELRKPLFDIYLQIGRAADNSNRRDPPFYEILRESGQNYYWYLASVLAFEDAALLKGVDPDLAASVQVYLDALEAGDFIPLVLSFEYLRTWNARDFASEYQVFINGLEVLISNERGQYRSPAGRTDVYLRRSDGYALSDSVELDVMDSDPWIVFEEANWSMGDVASHLLEDTKACTLELDGYLLNHLAIYSRLNPGSLYLAVSDARGTPLWRWDPTRMVLESQAVACLPKAGRRAR